MTLFSELRKTLALALPIATGHVSQMLLGFTDTFMIGKVSVEALAAVGFSNVIISVFLILGIGLLSSVSILVAHAQGASQSEEIGKILQRGLLLTLIYSVGLYFVVYYSISLVHHMGQPPEVAALSESYILILTASLPFALIVICLKNFSEAQDIAWPPFWAGLIAVLINIFLNWILIYGNWGAPRLELFGAGLATYIARILGLFILIFWLMSDRRFSGRWPVRLLSKINWKEMRPLIFLGLPVAFQLVMEIGAFGMAAILSGKLGAVPLASHQIVITYAALTFMVPLGIGLATGIRMGQVFGAGQHHRAWQISLDSILFTAILSGFFMLLFFLFNDTLAGLISDDPAVTYLAASLLIIAALFQLFDGLQVVAVGALRGCKDINIPTVIIVISFWVFGIPCAYLLAFFTKAGPHGIWIGLALGLALTASGLTFRLYRLTR